MAMILDEILEHKRTEIERLRERHAEWSPPVGAAPRRDFPAAIKGLSKERGKKQYNAPALIAEFKRRSPSRGEIRPGARPAALVGTYEGAGAAAVSVLTDERYFGGALGDLVEARGAVGIPVLRKDFLIDELQLAESCGPEGPDCLLLIAAALSVERLRDLRELAARCGQACLVEVHNEGELDRALESGAEIVGINNRDLRTFEVSLETTVRLRGRVPEGIPVVSESGIHCADDVKRLADAGVDAMLVGEALMAADDPAQKIEEMLGER